MRQYLDMLEHIIIKGEERADRTGTGTIGVFGYQNRYDLSKGFPAVTTKKLHLKAVIYELLWFLKGDTNLEYLLEHNVKIWNADYERAEKSGTHKNGNLGPIYGKQWRSWSGGIGYKNADDDYPQQITIDQIAQVIDSIKNDPYGRRHIVNAWNVADIPKMALPPCHVMFQFYVSNDGRLSCQLYQRSADVFLGVPFNIASYALLTHMIAHVCGLQVGEFVHTFGDLHIYKNHLEQVSTQIKREPLPLPTLKINREVKDINDFKFEDFELVDYKSHSAIKGSVSVG